MTNHGQGGGRACECCLLVARPEERGWVVDTETGGDFCPECAYSLAGERIRELEAALRGLYDFLPRYSCKADAPDGCPVCVAKAALSGMGEADRVSSPTQPLRRRTGGGKEQLDVREADREADGVGRDHSESGVGAARGSGLVRVAGARDRQIGDPRGAREARGGVIQDATERAGANEGRASRGAQGRPASAPRLRPLTAASSPPLLGAGGSDR